jgi:hypothetical protein
MLVRASVTIRRMVSMTRLIVAFAASALAASVAVAQPQEAINVAGEFQAERVADGHALGWPGVFPPLPTPEAQKRSD